MNEDHFKAITMFFFYAFLDESLAYQASVKTVRKCRQRASKKSASTQAALEPVIVFFTRKYWQHYSKQLHEGSSGLSFEAGWLVPNEIDLSAWRQLLKEAEGEELLVLIWSKILKFSDSHISEGLGVTEGTVRYRVSRTLRHLGGLMESEPVSENVR